jgi:MFS family permease
MVPLGLVLFTREATGSFGSASVVIAAFLTGGALIAPARGRWIDKRGVRIPLPLMATVTCGALGGVVAAGEGDAPLAALAAFGFIAGAGAPPVNASLRTLFGQLVGREEQLHTAYAMFTVVSESTLFSGPLIAGILLAVASPATVVIAGAALAFVAVVSFASSPGAAAWKPQPRPHSLSRFGPLASAGMRTLLVSAFAFGVTFGQLESIALPAFAKAHDATPAAGVLLAAIALGIGGGSLVYGLRPARLGPGERYPWLCALALPALVAAPFVDAVAPMVALMLLFGVLLAPAGVTVFALVDHVAPKGMATEAISWVTSLSTAGTAIGALVAGAVVSRLSVEAALAGPAIVTAVATALMVLLRETLVRPR